MKLDGKTNEELNALRLVIEQDPENRAPRGELYLYTKAARVKLDAIARQVTRNIAFKRAAEGRPIVTDGYSGRKCNRRR
jgi:hypothetical protein